jgi:hypothetical protein
MTLQPGSQFVPGRPPKETARILKKDLQGLLGADYALSVGTSKTRVGTHVFVDIGVEVVAPPGTPQDRLGLILKRLIRIVGSYAPAQPSAHPGEPTMLYTIRSYARGMIWT